mmetsp:Transcript_12718/g.18700  ORF Transcript_12718/g.18700 Transcript_12718/m.18700 type:complete len:240 (-) Transcript_12718:370-1089(-)|eukprot:CAMPEP_0194221344 /NCGR_PEP_ID=MMETSP0156-20130528/30379_1 /TAXON_ID=33649 /ORGANISM="Thalassionema nitzschioides, Strain L26-B" /LENGTH=239 /DNA_ID=CAMNT_0038951711 /DNA_START=29 /DNA_END=748 /DNA_ORIENTATION=+
MPTSSQSPSKNPPSTDPANSTSAMTDNTESSVASKPSGGLDGDTTVAEIFQAIETLVAFGFPPDIAQQAIDAVGTDPVEGYTYILDNNLAADSGGCVIPISNCPHIEHHVLIQPYELASPQSLVCTHVQSKASGGSKEVTDADGICSSKENWICLHCGIVRCSRYVNGHAVQHYEDTLLKSDSAGVDKCGHCVAVSLADLSVWCYACKSYLKDSSTVEVLVKKLEELKFGKGEEEKLEI